MKAIVYSRENCQWCDRVKYLLDHLKISYIEYLYEKDFTKDQFYNEFGVEATFPQVSIDNNYIGGCKETLNYLKEHQLV